MGTTLTLARPRVVLRVRWAAADFAMVATVAAWIAHVVQVPPIPLSPIVYMPFVLLALCRREWHATRGALLREPALMWMAGALGLEVVLLIVVRGVSYSEIAEAGRFVSGMVLLVAIAAYTASHPARLARALWTVVTVSVASSLWFLLELALPDAPLVDWRMAMYADIYAVQEESIVETVRSGLAPYRHLLGYPLAAAIPLLLVPLLGPRATAVERYLSAVGLGIAMAGLVLSLQRSALASAMLGALVLLVALRSGRALWRAVLVLAIAVAAAVALTRAVPVMAEVMQGTLVDKLQSQEGGSDTEFRMRLQLRAVELLAAHPLGLPAAGLSWNDVGFYYVYDRMKAVADYEHPFAVHNGYLNPALNYGVGLLAVSLAALCATVVAAARAVWPADGRDPGARAWGIGAAAAVTSLFSFQAGMHNASILSLEPVSIVCFACLVGHVATQRLRHIPPADVRP